MLAGEVQGRCSVHGFDVFIGVVIDGTSDTVARQSVFRMGHELLFAALCFATFFQEPGTEFARIPCGFLTFFGAHLAP